jgi:hypothetical protein
LVAAMGNGGTRTRVYPAAFAKDHAYVIAVGATDVLDQHASCSNTNSYITVGAPASNIVSLRAGGGTMTAPCGTSAATAVVSGIAAMIASKYPGIAPASIKSRIANSADDIDAAGRDELSGYGRVNAQRAIWSGANIKVALSRPSAAGATNRSTLRSTITSAAGVAGAEYFIDAVGAPGAGKKMSTSGGKWGATKEVATATINTTSLGEGTHTVYVRGKDLRNRWGAASTAVVVVDRTAPTMPTFKIDPAYVIPGDPRTKLILSVGDALSRTVRVTISFIDATDVTQASFVYNLPPASYNADWRGTIDRPGATSFTGRALPPGPYIVRGVARDESGRTVTVEARCAIAPDTRADAV